MNQTLSDTNSMSGPNYTKLKTNLRLIINRLKLLEKKKTEMALKSRKEIADYISAGKEDRARIRVEHIIREDYLVEAMELLEMYSDLLLARFGLIQTQKELDPGLEEAIASIIWATPRLQADVQELKAVTDEFAHKYGKEFAQACRGNQLSNVNEKVMHKLSVQAPPKALVERYMVEISKSYNVPFEPDPSVMQQDEILLAENLLIDLGMEDKKNMEFGAGGPPPHQGFGPGGPPNPGFGPGGPSHPGFGQGGQGPPPLPNQPPHGGVSPYPPPAYNSGASTGPPNFDQLYDNNSDDIFPELPTVPSNTLPDPGNSIGGGSVGGEDVDFDDLTRRFEQLKKKK
ncbi:hypothetical protein EGW08_005880 [Elysia chlorotica]|uniref:IST1 homolog n=1 Tax=Elysia chlorotica TaxID=188477 RepID=A0A3S1BLC5_ELYCH|nr:hypothetical protein EGW08_005880 [Elysia chlorotica]